MPEWDQKDILESILIPLGEGSVECPEGMKQVGQVMHVLLSQSVLSSCKTGNKNDSYLQGNHWSPVLLFIPKRWGEEVRGSTCAEGKKYPSPQEDLGRIVASGN